MTVSVDNATLTLNTVGASGGSIIKTLDRFRHSEHVEGFGKGTHK